MRIHHKIIAAVYTVILLMGAVTAHAQGMIEITGHQKISNIDGGLGGILNPGGRFGDDVTWLGDIGPGAPTSKAIAVGNPFNGKGSVWIIFLNDDGTVFEKYEIKDGVPVTENVNGFSIPGNWFGYSVASLGDLDGDGFLDIAVGEIDSNVYRMEGTIWILFLNGDGSIKRYQEISEGVGGFPANFPESSLEEALDPIDDFGTYISNIGDFNGDNVVDLAVGAPGDDDGTLVPATAQAGAVWILLLNSDGTVKKTHKISQIHGNGPLLTSTDDNRFGDSVSSAGDIDGNGVIDLAVGGIFDPDSAAQHGAVWILFMQSDGSVREFTKNSSVDGILSDALDDGDRLGLSLSKASDIDGDGINELIAGAYLDDDGGTDRGALYVLFLNDAGAVRAYEKISNTQGGFTGLMSDHNRFGSDVEGLGDVNGDGVADIIVGAHGDSDGGANSGAVWILFLEQANMKPIADAGENVIALVDTTVTLDGSNSSDPDGDTPLIYSWNICSKPAGSTTDLSSQTIVNPTIYLDLVGDYEIRLQVTDTRNATSVLDPDRSYVTVTAMTADEYFSLLVLQLQNEILPTIPSWHWQNTNRYDFFLERLADVVSDYNDGLYLSALKDLRKFLIERTDGCPLRGTPDNGLTGFRDDIITDCESQNLIYPSLLLIEEILESRLE